MALKTRGFGCASALALTLGAGTAIAAEPGAEAASGEVTEIVVTATKRETRLQETPLSISAYDAEYLRRNNVATFAQLANSIPNLQAPESLTGINNVAIRGISSPARQGAGVEQPVGAYLDQVYVGRGLLDALVFDIQQVEVIRGPQGTLFGRNTAGGAITYTSRRPTWTPNAYVEAEAGNFDLRALRAAVSGPLISDKVAARLAVAHRERQGYFSRLSGGSFGAAESDAVRASITLRPVDGLQVDVIASHLDHRGTPSVGLYVSGSDAFTLGDGALRRVAEVNGEVFLRNQQSSLTVLARYDVQGYELALISGYARQKERGRFDEDMTAQDIIVSRPGGPEPNLHEQISHELRLTSPSGGRIEFTTGLYYYEARHQTRQFNEYGPVLTDILVSAGQLPPVFARFADTVLTDSRTGAWAWYGQANLRLTERLTVIVGLRANREEKRFGANADAFRAFDQDGTPIIMVPSGPLAYFETYEDDVLTPTIGIQYRLAPDVMTYGSFSRGYKSGGFNTASADNAAVAPFFGPEQADSYELGVRSQWLARRLTVNATLFWLDYSNLQTQQFVGLDSQVVNAGKARSRGFELELNAELSRSWRLSWGLGHTDATYLDFRVRDAASGVVIADYTGNRLPFAPRWTSTISSVYDMDLREAGRLSLQGELAFASAYYQELTNHPAGRDDGYELVNGRITWRLPAASWEVALWGRNLTDERVKVDFNGQLPPLIFGDAQFQAFAAPRTYGVEVRAEF